MSNEVQQAKITKLGTCTICKREGSFGQSQCHEKLWVCFSPDHPPWAGSYFMGAMHGAWAELTDVVGTCNPRELDLSGLECSGAAERDEQIYLESFGYPQFNEGGGEVLRRIWRHQMHRAMFSGLTLSKAKRHADVYVRLHLESQGATRNSSVKTPPDIKVSSEPKPARQPNQPKPLNGKCVSKKPRIMTDVQ